jgi:hypothetical protein
MGKVRVVTPPPENYEPEALYVAPEDRIIQVPEIEPLPEETLHLDGVNVISNEEINIAEQKRIEELTAQVSELEKRAENAEKEVFSNARVYADKIDQLTAQVSELEKRAENAKQEALVAFRKEQSGRKITAPTAPTKTQISMIQLNGKPSLWKKFNAFIRRKKIELSTIPITNYEQAVLNRAIYDVPKMLDSVEKVYDQMLVMEELIIKLKDRKKIEDSKKKP